MTVTTPLDLPALPNWETTPPDLAAATREVKAALRARIEASGRTVEHVFAVAEARQSERTARVQSFLNHLWRSESEGRRWFDPDRDSLYPDRIRRRPEGADSAGLGTHLDPGTLDLWMTQAYQKAFRHLFDGSV